MLTMSFCAVDAPKALPQSVEDYHQQAAELIRSYRFSEAAEWLVKGLRDHPENAQLKQQLGVLLVQIGRPAEGGQLLEKLRVKQPHDPKLLAELADAHLRQSRPASAIPLLEDAAWHRPQDAELQHRLSQALLHSGDYRRSLEAARRSVELDPLHSGHRRQYALLLDIAGQRSESYEQLKSAHRLSPDDATLLFQIGEKERLDGKLELATESIEAASRLDSENPLYHSALAELYLLLGQKSLSARQAERAQALSEAFEVYVEALELAENGDLDRAASLLRPLVQATPEFVTGAMHLARLYTRMGQAKQALEVYASLSLRDPAARTEAAWLLTQKEDYEAALRTLGETPQAGAARSLIVAYDRERAADYEGALTALRRAQSENPLNTGLLVWIAHCLHSSNHRAEALEVLAKVHKLRGDSTVEQQAQQIRREIAQERALELFNARQWKPALAAFDGLIEMQDGVDQASAWFHIAYCHQQLRELEDAVRDYRKGLKLDPKADWARQNLAGLLYQLGRFGDAISEWEQLPRNSRAPEMLFQLGLCYSYLGRFEEAERSFQSAVDQGKPTPALLYNLGVTRLRRMQPEDDAWDLIRRSADAHYPPARNLMKQAGFSR
jgi:tetratricopeptide (TPR) repeat protein